jgi:hypothetical protein
MSGFISRLDTLDELLERHAAALGADLVPYRHHAYRVLNFCAALWTESSRGAGASSTDEPQQREKMAIAVAFHDLGIWTDRTFDYLPPSIRLAREHLLAHGQAEWVPEIELMILEHHKLRRYRGHEGWLVEAFRQADWVDVSYGARSFGLPRSLLRDAFAQFPDQGFHRRLLELTLERSKTKPFSPLPMLRF